MGTAEQTRAEDSRFIGQCSLPSLHAQCRLPLKWTTPPEIPSSPKKSYRSAYVYPWQAELADPAQVLVWKNLSNFDLLLRLVDFSGLRPVLAHLLGWRSGRGWEPFDPVSFFLLTVWQITAARGLELKIRAEVDGVRLLASLAFQGFGAALLPASAAPKHLQSGTWKRVPVTDMTRRSVGLVTNRRSSPAAPAREVRRMIRETILQVGPEQPGLYPLDDSGATAPL